MQLRAMRAAIAELDLPKDTEDTKPYGYDLEIDDAEYTSSTGSQSDEDLWDLVDSDRVSSTGGADSPDINGSTSLEINGQRAFNTEWLSRQCARVASPTSGLDTHVLQEQLLDILRTNDETQQSRLVDILGYSELDLVSDLVSHRESIIASLLDPEHDRGPFERLLTRHERDAVLHRQDHEHKTATLQPSMDRSGPHYPHVYGAKNAGNFLSAFGQKYALPAGSEKTDHEKYEEFSIPASRVGPLASGEQLVRIQDMDQLCKGTFEGYKTLNRMQSLVYPVAYKTSENMLICAPTGAVSLIMIFN